MSSWKDCLANGIPVQSGALQPREEITTLSDAKLFLFAEGMRRFQQADQNDTLSYYQIAGIHGMPYQTWPPFDQSMQTVDPNTGYCTHSSILFLTWHRPYLALFESHLYKWVNDVVNDLANPDDDAGDGQTYRQLAQNFRLPYWDWARVGAVQRITPVCRNPQTYYTDKSAVSPAWKDPSAISSTYNMDYNPLFDAPFAQGTPDAINFATINGQPANRTVRYNSPEANQAWAQVYSIFGGEDGNPALQPKNLSERVGYLLASYGRFGAFSNNSLDFTAPPKSPTDGAEVYGSVEDIHNDIHDACGGGGHMSDIAVAAFDPIFWLHHSNVDRIFAIWEAIHQDNAAPRTWVTEQAQSPDTYAIASADQSAATPLYPFRHAVGESASDPGYPDGYFTSNTVKRVDEFGYTYPEIIGKPWPLSPAGRAELAAAMEAQYNTAATAFRMSMLEVPNAGEDLLGKSDLLQKVAANTQKGIPASHAEAAKLIQTIPDQKTLLKRSLEPSKPILRDALKDRKYHEWLINVRAEKHTLGGAYSIAFFLGPVEEDNVYLWQASPYFVGSFVPLGQNTETACAKCQDDQAGHLQVSGQIPLTIALMERYLAHIIPDMTEATIISFLQKNLHWRVARNGQVLADRSQVGGLTVFVVTNEVTLPEDPSHRPIYAPGVEVKHAVTTALDGTGRGNGTGLTNS